MKLLTLLLLIALTDLASANAEKITSSQKEKILQKLEKLLGGEKSARTNRAQVALKDFLSASNSPERAFKLYLKCSEQTNFIEKNKKSSDFRKWKSTYKKYFKDPNFSIALQVQLKWLCILLGASQSDLEKEDMVAKSKSFMHKNYQNLETFKDYESIITANCLTTIFAKTYKITNINTKGLPQSPVDIQKIYTEFITPSLKKEAKPVELREALLEMIEYEMKAILVWPPIWKRILRFYGRESLKYGPLGLKLFGASSKKEFSDKQTRELKAHISEAYRKFSKPKSKSLRKRTLGEMEVEKFKDDKLPQLMWNIERAVYNAGDEIGSSDSMMKQIMQFSSDPRAQNWAKELYRLLNKDSGQSQTKNSKSSL